MEELKIELEQILNSSIDEESEHNDLLNQFIEQHGLSQTYEPSQAHIDDSSSGSTEDEEDKIDEDEHIPLDQHREFGDKVLKKRKVAVDESVIIDPSIIKNDSFLQS